MLKTLKNMPNINRIGFAIIILSGVCMVITSNRHTFTEPTVFATLILSTLVGIFIAMWGKKVTSK